MPTPQKVKIIQISTPIEHSYADSGNGRFDKIQPYLEATIYGLGDDGVVYEFDRRKNFWEAISPKE